MGGKILEYEAKTIHNNGLRIGREQGREEGREEGREQGREEGREQGRKEGREQGRKEGREQGREEGREQGRTEKENSMIISMLKNKLSLEQIVSITGLTMDKIVSIGKQAAVL